jgi:hypothetical protein
MLLLLLLLPLLFSPPFSSLLLTTQKYIFIAHAALNLYLGSQLELE